MKVIEPLFLSELYEELEKAGKSKKKLDALLHRIHNIKIFDPACGSGNFLIIAYKELRILEMKIFKAGDMMALSGIQLSQFYGIEIDDFAGEIAKLSLWLAEHQMNVEFRKEFGRTNPTLPLSEAGNIVQGNACRLDWEEVCPKTNKFGEPAEVYILGNPPYLGSRMQQAAQKADMDYVFSFLKTYRDLDYISIWFYKGAQYIKGINSKCSFVSTNSICQGLQVGLLWPHIFKLGIEINFAHTSFKWTNNAKSKAGVTVVIIGLRNKNNKDSYLYSSQTKRVVNNINGYLVAGTNCIIEMRSTPISNFSIMQKGSQPTDGGNLILSEQEKERIVNKEPDSLNFIKKYIGSQEYIRGQIRYCIWIEDDQLEDAMKIESIKNRVQQVKYMRVKSTKLATQKLSEKPYAFGECRYKKTSAIIIPSVSSERRDYIPIGYLHDDTVISNLAFVIYNAEPFLIGVLSSNIHMIWVRTISGYLGTSLRYSNTLSYNTFPFPPISEQRKNEITQAVFRILEEREKHSDKTLAQLYDPDKMPDGLREAHRQNDLIIEKCYRSKPFTSDEERLEYLFKLYEKMIAEEKS